MPQWVAWTCVELPGFKIDLDSRKRFLDSIWIPMPREMCPPKTVLTEIWALSVQICALEGLDCWSQLRKFARHLASDKRWFHFCIVQVSSQILHVSLFTQFYKVLLFKESMKKGKLQECSDLTDPIVYSRLLRLSGYGVRHQYIKPYPVELNVIFWQLVPLCVWACIWVSTDARRVHWSLWN